MRNVNEQVHFRLINMPCCGAMICWVNPRLPNYCPECGQAVFIRLKSQPELTILNTEAWIKYKGE